MRLLKLPAIQLLALFLPAFAGAAESNPLDWRASLKNEISRLDSEISGKMGVYIKHLGDDSELSYGAHDQWYLASTTKVPVAIALLQRAENGQISLDQKLTLKNTDYVDGAGELLGKAAGTQFTLRDLLRRMITQSDSTATDMLIREMGEESLNRQIKEKIAPYGFSEFTSIFQVRIDAYSELHPKAAELTNQDFIGLKKKRTLDERLGAFMQKLEIKDEDLNAPDIRQAFEFYYGTGKNSGTLSSYGQMLENLLEGKLLSKENTELLLGLMEKIETGDRRIKAGLPKDWRFAQKTGTQIGRLCNMGIIQNDAPEKALVVAACMENYPNIKSAEGTLKELGKLLTRLGEN